jgi:hypothetical protein
MFVYIDDTVTRHDFVVSIYPKARYNVANSWDTCGEPHNDGHTRYCHFGKHDLAASLTPAKAVGRFCHWYLSKRADTEVHLLKQRNWLDTISLCWQFLGRLSHDVGIFQCVDVHNGDSAQGEAMMRQFKEAQRRGSLFWLGATVHERQALVDWQDDLNRQHRNRVERLKATHRDG